MKKIFLNTLLFLLLSLAAKGQDTYATYCPTGDADCLPVCPEGHVLFRIGGIWDCLDTNVFATKLMLDTLVDQDSYATSVQITGTGTKTITIDGVGAGFPFSTTFTDQGNIIDMITNVTLSGTNLNFTGQNGAFNSSVDLSSLQDGTGTDNQILSIIGDSLAISGGNKVALPTGGTHTGIAGSIFFASTAGEPDEDNNNLFWNNTNKQMAIGNNNPKAMLDVRGFTGSTLLNSIFKIGRDATGRELSVYHTDDSNTGYYKVATDDNLYLEVNQSPAHSFVINGDAQGGTFGIGTNNNTAAKLEVKNNDVLEGLRIRQSVPRTSTNSLVHIFDESTGTTANALLVTQRGTGNIAEFVQGTNTKLVFKNNGQLQLNDYTGSNFDNLTPSSYITVDALGNITKSPAPSGGGGNIPDMITNVALSGTDLSFIGQNGAFNNSVDLSSLQDGYVGSASTHTLGGSFDLNNQIVANAQILGLNNTNGDATTWGFLEAASGDLQVGLYHFNDSGIPSNPTDVVDVAYLQSQIPTVNDGVLTVNTGAGLSGGTQTFTADQSTNTTINLVNTAPDQIVTINGGGATTVTGAYPNFTVTSTDNNTQLSQEQVQDFIGTMVAGNTENGIDVTYNDAANKLDFDVTSTGDNMGLGFIFQKTSVFNFDVDNAGGLTKIVRLGNTLTGSVNGGGDVLTLDAIMDYNTLINRPTINVSSPTSTVSGVLNLASGTLTLDATTGGGGGGGNIADMVTGMVLSGNSLNVTGQNGAFNGSVDLSSLANTDNQALTITGTTLSISGGNSVTLPTGGGGGMNSFTVSGDTGSEVATDGSIVLINTVDPYLVTNVTKSGTPIQTNLDFNEVAVLGYVHTNTNIQDLANIPSPTQGALVYNGSSFVFDNNAAGNGMFSASNENGTWEVGHATTEGDTRIEVPLAASPTGGSVSPTGPQFTIDADRWNGALHIGEVKNTPIGTRTGSHLVNLASGQFPDFSSNASASIGVGTDVYAVVGTSATSNTNMILGTTQFNVNSVGASSTGSINISPSSSALNYTDSGNTTSVSLLDETIILGLGGFGKSMEVYMKSGRLNVKLGDVVTTDFKDDYASHGAADADTSLDSGSLYQLIGDRTIYRKP